MMAFIKNVYILVFLFFLMPNLVSAEDEDENKPQPLKHKLSCNVYGYGGEKTVVSGDIILLDRNARSPRELLVTFTDSSRKVSVAAAKALWVEDGSFSVGVENLPASESRRESRFDYDFHWRYLRSYVVITEASCLQCVAQRHIIVGTGLCDIHQVQIDEPLVN
jgi:hypothetical protein